MARRVGSRLHSLGVCSHNNRVITWHTRRASVSGSDTDLLLETKWSTEEHLRMAWCVSSSVTTLAQAVYGAFKFASLSNALA